jgi:hypothetical protein
MPHTAPDEEDEEDIQNEDGSVVSDDGDCGFGNEDEVDVAVDAYAWKINHAHGHHRLRGPYYSGASPKIPDALILTTCLVLQYKISYPSRMIFVTMALERWRCYSSGTRWIMGAVKLVVARL